jgi:hypothetical protein
MIERIISGGQTGVDRAALDFALEHGIPCGGWCPSGRLAEDGRIDFRYPAFLTAPQRRPMGNVFDAVRNALASAFGLTGGYPLNETPSADYAERTAWNVRDSDGTLVLTWGTPTGGTAYTVVCARDQNKPCFEVDFAVNPDASAAQAWIAAHAIRVLNVAGPRASTSPHVYAAARTFLAALFECG